MCVGCRSRKNIIIRNSLNLIETNIINKRCLNSSLVACKTIRSEGPPLRVGHNKLKTSPLPIKESLGPQERVQRRERRHYILKHWWDILIETKLPEYSVC